MRSEPRVVGIHGAPRSGTSWLGQLFNSHPHVAYRYQPFFSYAFRGRITGSSSPAQMRRFFDDLLASDDGFVNQATGQRLARSVPEFEKSAATHVVYKEVRFHHLIEPVLRNVSGARCIGIIRDPRDVLVSWFGAPREFNGAWTPAAEWRLAPRKNAGLPENWYGFERWKELARTFLHLEEHYPSRFTIVRYEDLVATPEGVLASLFDFCGLSFDEQTVRFIYASTSRDDADVYGVFRQHGKATARNPLPEDIATVIEQELLGTPLAPFLCGNGA